MDLIIEKMYYRMTMKNDDKQIEWIWIKGHNGHSENERCYQLAREEIIRCKKRLADETI